PEIAIGTAIGSSLTNLLLIAGIGAMIYPMNIQSAVLKKELPLMIIVILLAGLVVSNGHLGLREGCLLFFIGFASLFLMIKMLHKTLTQVRHVLPLETLSRFELQTNPRNSVALFWVVIALLIIPVATRMIIDNVF
ncbi:calcium/sodium antiporter, partial [Escherichia coli]